MLYKIISLDLDGTLLSSEKTISNKAKQWLHEYQEKGGYIVIATARKKEDAIKYANELKIRHGFLVSSNGLCITDMDSGSVHMFDTLAFQQIKRVVQCFLESGRKPHLSGSQRDYVIVPKINLIYHAKNLFYGLTRGNVRYLAESKLGSIKSPIEKIFIDGDVDEKLRKQIECIKDIRICMIDGRQFGVYNKSVDKRYALQRVIEDLNTSDNLVKDSDVLIFGDDDNDLGCFKYFENCVAMGNATAEIKKVAKYTTDTNDNDGVYNFLEGLRVEGLA